MGGGEGGGGCRREERREWSACLKLGVVGSNVATVAVVGRQATPRREAQGDKGCDGGTGQQP